MLAQRAGPAHPRGAGRLGRRPGLARGHRRARRSRTCAASRACSPPRRLTRFVGVGVLLDDRVRAALPAAARAARRRRARTRSRSRSPRSANTQANRLLHLRRPRPRRTSLRQHAMGALVFVLTLGLTSGALAVLHAHRRRRRRAAVELAVLDRRQRRAPRSRATSRCARWVFARARRVAAPRLPAPRSRPERTPMTTPSISLPRVARRPAAGALRAIALPAARAGRRCSCSRRC